MVDAVEALTVLGELPPRNHLTRRYIYFCISFVGETAANAFFRLLAKGVTVRVVAGRVLQDVLALHYNVWLLHFA